jgi:hypothetical protein
LDVHGDSLGVGRPDLLAGLLNTFLFPILIVGAFLAFVVNVEPFLGVIALSPIRKRPYGLP